MTAPNTSHPTIGILGTGPVARLLAERLIDTGHDVVLGSRTPAARAGTGFRVESLEDALAASAVLLNATPGHLSLAALTGLGAGRFDGKVLIDLANAVTPAFELVYPHSSLAERLQEALPEAEVVKTMNTASMTVVVRPPAGDPGNLFLSGNSPAAKEVAAGLLTGFGWPRESLIDLGDVHSARGPEHYFAMVPALAQAFGHPFVNLSIRSVRP